MSHGVFNIPRPINDPIRTYAPGSAEKASLKAELKRQLKEVAEIPVVIGGEKIYSKTTKDVICPHNKKHVIAKCHQASPADLQGALKASTSAQKEWSRLAWQERASVFLKAAELTATKYRDKVNAATMLGQSKSVYQAEIDSACEVVDFYRFNPYFAQQIYDIQPYSPTGQWNRLVARGLEGFVYAVTPFNFTAISLNLPSSPALMGCSVIWKPAQTAVHASYIGLQILEEAGLPPGVINFVPGDSAQISDVALGSPDFAGLHFTGSTSTFNHLWKKVAENIDKYKSYPRLVGETGGKDFVFVHASADPQEVAVALVRGAFEYQGQKCSAASRTFIPKSLWPQIKDRMVAMVKEIKMGDVEDFSNFMNAVIDQKAFDSIKGYIERTKAASKAKILVGGGCNDKDGFFIEPTIIEASDPKYQTMCEEIFGPVLSVYVYEEAKLEETLKLCDESSPYALTGSIFARDRRVVADLCAKLENAAGNFYINDKPTGATVGQQPFGGGRKSGTNDKAGSQVNLMRWVSHRTIKETFVTPTRYEYPFMGEK